MKLPQLLSLRLEGSHLVLHMLWHLARRTARGTTLLQGDELRQVTIESATVRFGFALVRVGEGFEVGDACGVVVCFGCLGVEGGAETVDRILVLSRDVAMLDMKAFVLFGPILGCLEGGLQLGEAKRVRTERGSGLVQLTASRLMVATMSSDEGVELSILLLMLPQLSLMTVGALLQHGELVVRPHLRRFR